MDTSSRRTRAGLVLVAALIAACGRSPQADRPTGPEAAAGYEVESAVTGGLEAPTQMIDGPDGRLWVAQLAGAEGAGEGQVVAVDRDGSDPLDRDGSDPLDRDGSDPVDRDGSDEPTVLLEGLDKPTGIAVLDGTLWIQQARSLLRAPLQQINGRTGVGEPEVVLDDLPSNGRSEGTLSVTDRDTLVYATSGSRDGAEAVEGSGMLWELDPARPRDPSPLARGLKNAYAQEILPDGRIALTDVLEPLPGVRTHDELNVLDEPFDEPVADFGWPRCVGRGVPVTELGADAASCDEAVDPIALLGEGSTPTSVLVAPWDEGELLVARWNVGDVVRVPLGGGDPEVVLSGVGNPQHLLVDGDAVLVSEHDTGTVHRLTGPAGETPR